MGGLAAHHLSSLHFLGILHRNLSRCIIQNQNKYNNCQYNSSDNQRCQGTSGYGLPLYKSFIQSCKITGHGRNDIHCQHNGNSISHTLFGYALAQPHKHGRTGSQAHNHYKRRRDFFEHRGIGCGGEYRNQSLTAKSYGHGNSFKDGKPYGQIAGNFSDLFPPIFPVLMHFFQLRDCNSQKLHNNGRRNVRGDIQRKDRHLCKRSSGKCVKEIKRIT